MTLPLPSLSSPGSIPQTFSPQTRVMPVIAAPMAKCSQFFLAISVEPRAPVKMGTCILTFLDQPYSVIVSTFGKRAVSGLGSTPAGRPSAPMAYPLNAEMRIVNGIILVGSCGDLSEGPRIEYFTAPERSQPGFASSPASV